MVPVLLFFYDNHNSAGVTDKYTDNVFKKSPSNVEARLLNKVKGGKISLFSLIT